MEYGWNKFNNVGVMEYGENIGLSYAFDSMAGKNGH